MCAQTELDQKTNATTTNNNVDGGDDVEQARPKKQKRTAKVHTIKNISIYPGNTLEERIDSLITLHDVVMINRSWCLFSHDAKEFLVNQLGVSVFSIDIDIHPDGSEIFSYVSTKTKHKTTPIIFVKGEYLGGFEDVNILYSTGALQNKYLVGLTQADQCEIFAQESNSKIQPLFWFPKKVNGYVIRMTGVLTCLTSILSVILVFIPGTNFIVPYICLGMLIDFLLRILGGGKISLLGRIAMILVSQMEETKPRLGRPKQFACLCGLMFSFLGTLFHFIPFTYHEYIGIVWMGGLAIATGMEGFLDFCLGCVFFRIGINMGIIPK